MKTSRKDAIDLAMAPGQEKEIAEIGSGSANVHALVTTGTTTPTDLGKRRKRKRGTGNANETACDGMAAVLAEVEVEVEGTEKPDAVMPVRMIEHLDNAWDFEAKRQFNIG